ncbi:MAG: ABC transporter ATP-binding protein [Desulfatibacillum sp.]|nr:ABC transporter ATP-binding protein [Desulfatibacillum sp.]
MSFILETQDLRHDFKGMKVIRGVDLQIRQGERHAIIGPNGAGKTTLFNLVTGMYRPRHGHILFKGQDVTKLKPYKRNRLGMGRSFQITSLFEHQTVFEHLRLGILSRMGVRYNFFKPMTMVKGLTEEVDAMLARVNLSEYRDQWASLLSYGKSRALEMTLTMATNPDLVLLDEPCAGMSAEETRNAVGLIRELTTGKSMIIVEHDMDVVFSLADRVTVLHYGKILACDTPSEIQKNKDVKDAYLGHGMKKQ